MFDKTTDAIPLRSIDPYAFGNYFAVRGLQVLSETSTVTSSTEKQLRMAIRRDIGNRSLPLPKSKVFGPARLNPYVCFNCNKSFKRKTEEGLPDKTCPHCKGVAIGLSRNFKAPQMDDFDQWKKVAFLVGNGFRFFYQHNAHGERVPYPATLAEAREFVALYGQGRRSDKPKAPSDA